MRRGANAIWDYAERRRRERHYRFMFKCALVFCAIGVLISIFGGASALSGGDGAILSFGLLVAVLSGASAWLSVDSTVRILELDLSDGGEER